MNKLICTFTLALASVTVCPLASFSQNSLENDPAYLAIDKAIDLKTIQPEVNIGEKVGSHRVTAPGCEA